MLHRCTLLVSTRNLKLRHSYERKNPASESLGNSGGGMYRPITLESLSFLRARGGVYKRRPTRIRLISEEHTCELTLDREAAGFGECNAT